MRLKNYLTESEKIKKLSEPFFKEFGDAYMSGDFIWRGHKDKIDKSKTKKRRTNRKPRLLSLELHEYLDEISKELFGWNVRSKGIFCGNYGIAENWGFPYIFVPLGNYRYIWNPDFEKVYVKYDKFDNFFEDMPEEKEEVKEELYREYQKYKTKGLPKALSQETDFEAIFDCDHYLLISQDYWETTMKEELLD